MGLWFGTYLAQGGRDGFFVEENGGGSVMKATKDICRMKAWVMADYLGGLGLIWLGMVGVKGRGNTGHDFLVI